MCVSAKREVPLPRYPRSAERAGTEIDDSTGSVHGWHDNLTISHILQVRPGG